MIIVTLGATLQCAFVTARNLAQKEAVVVGFLHEYIILRVHTGWRWLSSAPSVRKMQEMPIRFTGDKVFRPRDGCRHPHPPTVGFCAAQWSRAEWLQTRTEMRAFPDEKYPDVELTVAYARC